MWIHHAFSYRARKKKKCTKLETSQNICWGWEVDKILDKGAREVLTPPHIKEGDAQLEINTKYICTDGRGRGGIRVGTGDKERSYRGEKALPGTEKDSVAWTKE